VARYRDTTNPLFALSRDNRLNSADPSYAEYQVAHRGTPDAKDKNNSWFDYFGYSVSSGRYFDKTELLYAAGAPRGNLLKGEVVIFTIPRNKFERSVKTMIKVEKVIHGSENTFGSYFGFSLHSVDIDGDGKDELFVGAPQCTLKRQTDPKDTSNEDMEIENTRPKRASWISGDHGCVYFYKFGKSKVWF